MKKTESYRAYCHERKQTHRLRALRDSRILPDGYVEQEGKNYINLASNDYLGLSQHPDVIARACDYAQKFGAGATASRLITGNHPAYAEIETMIARGKGKERALLMAGGYQTNLTVLAALADKSVVGRREVTVVADRLAHHSLLQGADLSGARLMRFQHNDYDHLETILKTQQEKNAFSIIVSESVFGMDGDRADLAALGRLAQKYDALLYIDEAHATGVWGKNGFGFTADCPDQIDIAMGTCGKALGSFGSYIACSEILREYLIQKCGGLIYSTAMPPSILGSIRAALKLIPQMDAARDHLRKISAHLRQALQAQGWNCGDSTTQIIPVIVGDEIVAQEMAEILKQEGFLAAAIRPPTVPPGGSRLRFSLSAAHSQADIERLIAVMETLAGRAIKGAAA
jgi:8-amino-7-oxononanoate synthase